MNQLSRANSDIHLQNQGKCRQEILQRNDSIPALANPNKRICIQALIEERPKAPPLKPELKRMKTEPLVDHRRLLAPP